MKQITLSDKEMQDLRDEGRVLILREIEPQPQKNGLSYAFNGQFFVDAEDCASYIFHEYYGVNGTPYGSAYYGGGDVLRVADTKTTVKIEFVGIHVDGTWYWQIELVS